MDYPNQLGCIDTTDHLMYSGMKSNQTTERFQTEAKAELRRAVRDFPAVEVVDASEGGLTVEGDADSVREVKRALWTRELSARQFGQDTLAAADATARSQLGNAA